MSSFDYMRTRCAECGKLISVYSPKHDCIEESINFEELGIKERTIILIKERTILLAAFDHGVNDEGCGLTPKGDRMFSKETIREHLKVGHTLVISGPGGELEIHEGTPTAIADYLRRLEKRHIARA